MTLLPFEPAPASQPATGFAEFWIGWPRKVAKRAAEQAWRRAVKRDTPENIIAGRDRYIRNKPDYCDWMHPTTFLNGDRWNDQYTTFTTTSGRAPDGLALEVIAKHVKRSWYQRGTYPRDVLERCVAEKKLTRDEAEAAL